MAIESVSSAAVSTALNTPQQPRTPGEETGNVSSRPPERPQGAERTQTTQAARQPEQNEPPRASVNSSGQTVGRIVNTTA